jgi:hypothetical protein
VISSVIVLSAAFEGAGDDDADFSYATEQKGVAEPIALSLRDRGHHVFLDQDDLPPGRTFDEQIQKAVEQSDVMIFLISPTSVAKGRYTRTELEFARAAWRHPANRVLPVMIELRNPRRWATSVIATALAAAAFSTVAIAFLYDPSKFLAELPPALAVLSMWYVFAGGLLGFWVGRGQAT